MMANNAGGPGSNARSLHSLSGCYLLIVVGEPTSSDHRDVMLQKINKGFLSWDLEGTGCCISAELQYLVDQEPQPEEAKNGEKLIQFVSENLVTEVLINPQINTLQQCMKNLMNSYTKHKHIIHAGYSFTGSGSWILQDSTYSFADFLESFNDAEVQRLFKTYENSISIHVHCAAEGDWTTARLNQEPVAKLVKAAVNPNDKCSNLNGIGNFVNFLGHYVIVEPLEKILEPSEVVGNIRFSRPTLYIFPGGQGDSALFGVNGFNMLIDGGFNRKACFWDFARHLDRVDAVLVTRINNSNVNGVSSFFKRKAMSDVYPKIGHVFCNILDRKHSPDGDKDNDSLLVSLAEEGNIMMDNLRHLGLKPQNCYRESTVEAINLYHKVGHGNLDMYVLNPAKDSREVKEFLQQWHSQSSALGSSRMSIKVGNKELLFPLPNLMSICAILVWQPADYADNITRILFPGSSPQSKIFEGLEKLRHLSILKAPTCSENSLKIIPIKHKPKSAYGENKLLRQAPKIEKILHENESTPPISKYQAPLNIIGKPNVEKEAKLIKQESKSLSKIQEEKKPEIIKSLKSDEKKSDIMKSLKSNEKKLETKSSQITSTQAAMKHEKKSEPKKSLPIEKKTEKKKPQSSKVTEGQSAKSHNVINKLGSKSSSSTVTPTDVAATKSVAKAKGQKELTNKKAVEEKNKTSKKIPQQPVKKTAGESTPKPIKKIQQPLPQLPAHSASVKETEDNLISSTDESVELDNQQMLQDSTEEEKVSVDEKQSLDEEMQDEKGNMKRIEDMKEMIDSSHTVTTDEEDTMISSVVGNQMFDSIEQQSEDEEKISKEIAETKKPEISSEVGKSDEDYEDHYDDRLQKLETILKQYKDISSSISRLPDFNKTSEDSEQHTEPPIDVEQTPKSHHESPRRGSQDIQKIIEEKLNLVDDVIKTSPTSETKTSPKSEKSDIEKETPNEAKELPSKTYADNPDITYSTFYQNEPISPDEKPLEQMPEEFNHQTTAITESGAEETVLKHVTEIVTKHEIDKENEIKDTNTTQTAFDKIQSDKHSKETEQIDNILDDAPSKPTEIHLELNEQVDIQQLKDVTDHNVTGINLIEKDTTKIKELETEIKPEFPKITPPLSPSLQAHDSQKPPIDSYTLTADKDIRSISPSAILSPIPEDAPKLLKMIEVPSHPPSIPVKEFQAPIMKQKSVPAPVEFLRTPDEVADLPIHEEVPTEYDGYYHFGQKPYPESSDLPKDLMVDTSTTQSPTHGFPQSSSKEHKEDNKPDDEDEYEEPIILSRLHADHAEVVHISTETSPSTSPHSPHSPRDKDAKEEHNGYVKAATSNLIFTKDSEVAVSEVPKQDIAKFQLKSDVLKSSEDSNIKHDHKIDEEDFPVQFKELSTDNMVIETSDKSNILPHTTELKGIEKTFESLEADAKGSTTLIKDNQVLKDTSDRDIKDEIKSSDKQIDKEPVATLKELTDDPKDIQNKSFIQPTTTTDLKEISDANIFESLPEKTKSSKEQETNKNIIEKTELLSKEQILREDKPDSEHLKTTEADNKSTAKIEDTKVKYTETAEDKTVEILNDKTRKTIDEKLIKMTEPFKQDEELNKVTEEKLETKITEEKLETKITELVKEKEISDTFVNKTLSDEAKEKLIKIDDKLTSIEDKIKEMAKTVDIVENKETKISEKLTDTIEEKELEIMQKLKDEIDVKIPQKETTQTSTEKFPELAKEEQIQEHAKEKLSEQFKEKLPEPVVEKLPELVKEIIPEHVKEHLPEVVTKEKLLEQVKEKSPEQDAEKSPEQDAEKLPVSEQVNEKLPEQIKEKLPEQIKEKLPEQIKEKLPEQIKEKLQEQIKEKSPEQIKEKSPETIIEEKLPEVEEKLKIKSPEQEKEKLSEPIVDKLPEKAKEKLPEQTKEKLQDQAKDNLQELVVSEQIQEKMPEQVLEKFSENLHEQTKDKSPEKIQEKQDKVKETTLEQVKEILPEQFQEQLLENVKEKLPDKVHERLLEKVENKLIEQVKDKLPDQPTTVKSVEDKLSDKTVDIPKEQIKIDSGEKITEKSHIIEAAEKIEEKQIDKSKITGVFTEKFEQVETENLSIIEKKDENIIKVDKPESTLTIDTDHKLTGIVQSIKTVEEKETGNVADVKFDRLDDSTGKGHSKTVDSKFDSEFTPKNPTPINEELFNKELNSSNEFSKSEIKSEQTTEKVTTKDDQHDKQTAAKFESQDQVHENKLNSETLHMEDINTQLSKYSANIQEETDMVKAGGKIEEISKENEPTTLIDVHDTITKDNQSKEKQTDISSKYIAKSEETKESADSKTTDKHFEKRESSPPRPHYEEPWSSLHSQMVMEHEKSAEELKGSYTDLQESSPEIRKIISTNPFDVDPMTQSFYDFTTSASTLLPDEEFHDEKAIDDFASTHTKFERTKDEIKQPDVVGQTSSSTKVAQQTVKPDVFSHEDGKEYEGYYEIVSHKPEFETSSPKHEFETSPKHEFKTSPKHEFETSPKHEFKTSPKHEFKTSPKHEFETSSPKHELDILSHVHDSSFLSQDTQKTTLLSQKEARSYDEKDSEDIGNYQYSDDEKRDSPALPLYTKTYLTEDEDDQIAIGRERSETFIGDETTRLPVVPPIRKISPMEQSYHSDYDQPNLFGYEMEQEEDSPIPIHHSPIAIDEGVQEPERYLMHKIPEAGHSPMYISADEDTEEEYRATPYEDQPSSDLECESPYHKPVLSTAMPQFVKSYPRPDNIASDDSDIEIGQHAHEISSRGGHHLQGTLPGGRGAQSEKSELFDKESNNLEQEQIDNETYLAKELYEESENRDIQNEERYSPICTPEYGGSPSYTRARSTSSTETDVEEDDEDEEDKILRKSYYQQDSDKDSPEPLRKSLPFATKEIHRKGVEGTDSPYPTSTGSGAVSLSSPGDELSSCASVQDDKKQGKPISRNPFDDWGEPMGLPSPPPPPLSSENTSMKRQQSKNGALSESKDNKNKDNGLLDHHINGKSNVGSDELKKNGTSNEKQWKKSPASPKRNPLSASGTKSSPMKIKRPESPLSTSDSHRRSNAANKPSVAPIYVDLTYIPHHGNPFYADVEFFRAVRARYYVFSGTSPSKEVFNALLEAKQSWENPDLEVTIIPTYDTDTLGYWLAVNEELLSKNKIDLAPSASRCTINLQDHETSCSAYRLEF